MKDLELQKKIDNSDYTPLVIVDFNVMLWKIIPFYEEAKIVFKNNHETVAKLATAFIFNRGPIGIRKQDYKLLIIADSRDEDKYGGYWRHYEVERDERIKQAWNNTRSRKKIRTYKGGRGVKSDTFHYIREIAKTYCEKYINFYEYSGFEADDIAGALYRSQLREQVDRIKMFYTVDRDWTQLVDDNLGFYWYTPRIPKPIETFQEQCANNADIILHAETKLNYSIDHPKKLIEAKIIQGDMGDNLPPGTPREYMDLTVPHPVYNIESMYRDKFNSMVEDSLDFTPNNNLDHLLESEETLRKMNLKFEYTELKY